MVDFTQLFMRLYDRAPVGLDEVDLTRAEQRLGLSMPPPLRALYLVCGREERVMDAHNVVVAPPDLERRDGRLVICEENQGVCVWGCVVGGDDPIVEQGNGDSEGVLDWFSADLGLSRFLEITVYLQAALGGLEHTGDLQRPERAMRVIATEWEEVVRHDGVTIWARDGALVTSFDGDGFLTCAARTPERLAELERDLGFAPL